LHGFKNAQRFPHFVILSESEGTLTIF